MPEKTLADMRREGERLLVNDIVDALPLCGKGPGWRLKATKWQLTANGLSHNWVSIVQLGAYSTFRLGPGCVDWGDAAGPPYALPKASVKSHHGRRGREAKARW